MLGILPPISNADGNVLVSNEKKCTEEPEQTEVECAAHTKQRKPLPSGINLRSGDVDAVSQYFGVPVVLVSEYKREYKSIGPSMEKDYLEIHYCKVISSKIKEIPFNSTVVYWKRNEGFPKMVSPDGQLFYILKPSVRQINSITEALELHQYCEALSIDADEEDIKRMKSWIMCLQ